VALEQRLAEDRTWTAAQLAEVLHAETSTSAPGSSAAICHPSPAGVGLPAPCITSKTRCGSRRPRRSWPSSKGGGGGRADPGLPR
jgi:hypothetical protein